MCNLFSEDSDCAADGGVARGGHDDVCDIATLEDALRAVQRHWPGQRSCRLKWNMADYDLGPYTPRLEYLSLKRAFLSKFLDWKAWEGEFGSREQLTALSSLLGFFQKTKRLAEEFLYIASDVNIGNKDLVINHILPFPPKLYEQVIAAAVGEDHQQAGQVWRQPVSVVLSRIEQFLTRLHTANLAYYEHLVWSDVHDFSSYTFRHWWLWRHFFSQEWSWQSCCQKEISASY